MNRFESIENLERLRMALTIVIDNDIIIPYIEQKDAFLSKKQNYMGIFGVIKIVM